MATWQQVHEIGHDLAATVKIPVELRPVAAE